jgi:two-component system, chemotaxis family, protein-glutamate methylesterase/glutaminase
MTRVIVADDSSTVRQMLRAMLQDAGDIEVIAEAADGREAVRLVEELRPDVVLMDVHMPVCDGLEATKEIMMNAPTPIVIVSAAASRDDVDLSLSATQAGALIALPKPEDPSSPRFPELRDEIIAMVRAMAQVKVVRRLPHTGPARTTRRRSAPVQRMRAIAMAASTGGPPALRRILLELPRDFGAPILVVQHIARAFTAGFAEWLARSCALPVKLAEHGERLRDGTVYIAPDDRHLGISHTGLVQLSDAPPIGGFRPAATHLFRSASAVYGNALAAVVLTGMGTDGAVGLRAVHDAGGYVLAQDSDTSVVYGMAQEAERLQLVDELLPLGSIASRLVELVMRSAYHE